MLSLKCLPNSFVALYSASNSLELFYILNVIEKEVADNDITDIYGHIYVLKSAQLTQTVVIHYY